MASSVQFTQSFSCAGSRTRQSRSECYVLVFMSFRQRNIHYVTNIREMSIDEVWLEKRIGKKYEQRNTAAESFRNVRKARTSVERKERFVTALLPTQLCVS